MKRCTFAWVLSILLLGGAVLPVRAGAAELWLRAQAAPTGNLVRVGDVADVSAETTEECHQLLTIPLLAAPAPGTRIYLHRSEVQEFLQARGIDPQQLVFLGAQTVAIGEAVPTGNPSDPRARNQPPTEQPSYHVVVATRAIPAGDFIGGTDVELVPQLGRPARGVLSSLDGAIGQEARSPLAQGSVVREHHLRPARQVLRGETVTIYARTGGVTVKTYAIARQDGALGDLIQVQTLDKKERYTARISGRRQLEVLAAANQAHELATLGRPPTRQR